MADVLKFKLDDQEYGVPLADVRRVLPAVAYTPLSSRVPALVLGVIDVQGKVIPLIDMRTRCGHPRREVGLSDHIILADTPLRTVALLVDAAGTVIRCPMVPAHDVLPDMDLIAGAVRMKDGLILVTDLARLLSLDEEAALEGALV